MRSCMQSSRHSSNSWDGRCWPQLLGGVVVDVAGTIYDGSVRTQLHTLANRIAGGRSLQ